MNFGVKCLLTLGVICQSVCHAEVTLRFKQDITQEARQLSDVLVIQNAPKEWGMIPLDSTPQPRDRLSKDRLMEWLTSHLGHFNATWQGPTHIRVQPTVLSSKKALLDKATTALLQHLKPHYRRVIVVSTSTLRDSEYPLTKLTAEVSLPFPVPKRVCVWLTHEKKRIPVWFKVRAYSNVLVAKHPLHGNSLVNATDFKQEERDISGELSPTETPLLNARWLKSSMGYGDILLKNQLKAVPLIVHGQPLRVLAHQGGITVTLKGIALSDGDLGDTITVKNTLNHTRLLARVTGAQQAEVTS